MENRRPFSMTRRRWIVLHAVLMLLIAYVSSYAFISRKRFKQYEAWKVPGFLYVSPECLANDPDETWRVKNGLMHVLYAPLNKIDQELFRAPGPTGCILTGIGPKKGSD